jgi:ribosomal protein S6--L-glutamate ligase
MFDKLNVLSYHLLLETNNNRLAYRLDGAERAAMKQADAILLPQGCSRQLYEAASLSCPHVFPNYDAFFRYPGKVGQALLFQQCRVSHPVTQAFADLAEWRQEEVAPAYPFVFKFSWGGEGKNVFLITEEDAFRRCLELAADYENSGKNGFLLQEYIQAAGRSLRVVVMADTYVSYWRCQEGGDLFYSNIARGATINHDFAPELQAAAIQELKKFCRQTGINLAGFDFLFDFCSLKPKPLFLEINYFFRSYGLGGPDAYLKMLTQAVRKWLDSLKI